MSPRETIIAEVLVEETSPEVLVEEALLEVLVEEAWPEGVAVVPAEDTAPVGLGF
jgi:hypothetical protein